MHLSNKINKIYSKYDIKIDLEGVKNVYRLL